MFFGIFLWFYFSSLPPFLRKQNKTKQKEEKRKEILLLMLYEKNPAPIAQLFVPDLSPA